MKIKQFDSVICVLTSGLLGMVEWVVVLPLSNFTEVMLFYDKLTDGIFQNSRAKQGTSVWKSTDRSVIGYSWTVL